MREELTKKLAEWAEFEFVNFYFWLYPDGSYHKQAPNFPESLDACVEWLVPKLNEMGWGIHFIQQASNNAYWKCVIGQWGNPFREELRTIREDAETPALALCLAIERLIDSEKRCVRSE